VTVGDGITNDNTLSLSGTAAANSTVKVVEGTTQVGQTTADGSGALERYHRRIGGRQPQLYCDGNFRGHDQHGVIALDRPGGHGCAERPDDCLVPNGYRHGGGRDHE
jgi:hypothetical protein